MGDNRPHFYMAYGDSLSVGIGSSDGRGYTGHLEETLRGHFGAGDLFIQARDGNHSWRAVRLLEEALHRIQPGFTLIMVGTNDWNFPACQNIVPCDTIDNIQEMVAMCRDSQSLPVIATIPPVNPDIDAARNDWVEATNDHIRQLGNAEGVLVADAYAAFGNVGDLSSYFVDHVHFNDAGYEIVAEAFFQALAHGRIGAASHGGAGPLLLEAPRPGY
jgi:lysophospholipase L1-like esterase